MPKKEKSKKMQSQTKQSKVCKTCGRNFQFRSKWKETWENVKYCSKKCSRKPQLSKDLLESIIKVCRKDRVSEGHNGTVSSVKLFESLEINKCLPERLSPQEKIERIKSAVRILWHRGELNVLQNNRPVKDDNFRGEFSVAPKSLDRRRGNA